MKEIYTDAGYRKFEVAFGQKPAIVVVDFQNAFTSPIYPTSRSELMHQTANIISRSMQLKHSYYLYCCSLSKRSLRYR